MTAIDDYVLGNPSSQEGALGPLAAERGRGPADPNMRWAEWEVPFPTPGYKVNDFYDDVGPILGLLMCLCLVYPLAMLIRGLVEEKETRTRETM